MKLLIFLTLFTYIVGANSLKIANYNVENLFDLKKNGYEYREYIPYRASGWNKKSYQTKQNNIARVIKDIDADIIALEEIESLQALKDLRYTLKRKGVYYPYYAIANTKNTTVKVALLSKIPFRSKKEIWVTSSYKYRNILEVKLQLNKETLYVFVNHWKSKSGAESHRIVSAKALRKRIRQLPRNANIIVLGDFNSDYEEYKRFKRNRKLNNTHGITGINHILGTYYYQKTADKTKLKNLQLYNLWYDIKPSQRYSYIFRGKKEAMDSILVSQAVLEDGGIVYKKGSMHPFEAPYLFKGKYIYRWQLTRARVPKHKAKGYSDHLPIVATFNY